FMRDMNYMQISFPVAIYFMGQKIFDVDRNIFFRTMDVNATWMFMYIFLTSLICLLICILQVRKAERG
ncbi:MAG: hypothetical protein LDL53_12495, partial [Candidatus Hydrogenedens sp.]|nr:hypothetical protein [Candidatus Hydrogenedens sp.]